MPTKHTGTKAEIRALNAYIALLRAGESVAALAAAQVRPAGLTLTQFGALEALHHLGPLRLGDLGRKLLRSGGNVTLVVDNLERDGLVKREREGGDRRCVTVALTEKGRRLIGEVFPGHAEVIAGAMGALAAAEQEELRRLCRKLGLAAAGA